LIEEERHREAAEPPAGKDKAPGALEEVPGRPAPFENNPPRRVRPYRYFKIGKHRSRTLDPDAGARSYSNGRAWFGG
jgi:hypothetical protein